jgi:TRAP-type mannitol/chloroaromatic compound transport system substrate-binding protein
MDRRSILKNAGIAGVLAAGAAPAVHAQQAIRWRLASSFPKALDTIYGGAEVMARKVKEMTGGKFEISVHSGGELMPAFGVVDGVQNGTVEICHTVPYYFYGKNPAFALGSAVPFGLNSRQMTAWMFQGNGRKLMNELYANYNMISFAGGNTGTQMGGWFRKEIKGPGDFKGMKMRLGGGLIGEVMQEMGAVPQSIPGGEIYQALEKGTIDAAEWVGPYDDQKLGFNKVAPFYYYPGWWEGGPEVDFFINRKAFDALPGRIRGQEPGGTQAADRRQDQGPAFLSGGARCIVCRVHEGVRGQQCQEPRVEKDLRRHARLPARSGGMVRCGRSQLRPLHDPSEAVIQLL